MPDDLLCVQFNDRGKFHVVTGTHATACSGEYQPTTEIVYRHLSLVDSKYRCRHDKCIAARVAAAARR